MLAIELTAQFRRDKKRMEKRGCDMTKLRGAILLLASEAEIPSRLKDHALKGNWEGCRDLHIEADWLLIYEIKDNTLGLARTGTHADLFGG